MLVKDREREWDAREMFLRHISEKWGSFFWDVRQLKLNDILEEINDNKPPHTFFFYKAVLNFALKCLPPTVLPDNLPVSPGVWKEIWGSGSVYVGWLRGEKFLNPSTEEVISCTWELCLMIMYFYFYHPCQPLKHLQRLGTVLLLLYFTN